jgi:hypothetical protein
MNRMFQGNLATPPIIAEDIKNLGKILKDKWP